MALWDAIEQLPRYTTYHGGLVEVSRCVNGTGALLRFEDVVALLASVEVGRSWHPMKTAPKDGQPFLIAWSEGRHSLAGHRVEMISGWREYQEVLNYGEPPADGWMPLPDPPSSAVEAGRSAREP